MSVVADARPLTLDEAALILGMTPEYLRLYLSRYPDLVPPRYEFYGRLRVRRRLLTRTEIRIILEHRAAK